jgi:MazG family protein
MNRPDRKLTEGIVRLRDVMAKLRDRHGGCPWDLEQDFSTIAPYTIEEAYEVADAIERNDMVALRGELGDLLFQVVYHAHMAAEDGAFKLADVVDAITEKMVRRHPHVFGDADVADAEAQTRAWEEHKAAERDENGEQGNNGVLDGIARGLPALLRASKLQQRASRVGFDWRDASGAMAKLHEEIAEFEAELTETPNRAALESEIGDVLFSVVNVARLLGIDPESALRGGNAKFERRFRRLEAMLAQSGRKPGAVSLDEYEELWQRTKADE